MKNRLVILGAGDFAREVADLAIRCKYEVYGFYDNLEKGTIVYRDIPCLGNDDDFEKLNDNIPYVIGIGDPNIRSFLFMKFFNKKSVALIDPSAQIIGDEVFIEEGSLITANVVITNRVHVAKHSIVNLSCTIGHDCIIGRFSNLSPGCHINGHTTIEERCNIGSGTVTVPGAIIRRNSVIGAGAVVKGEIPENSLAVGCPAKVIKTYENK